MLLVVPCSGRGSGGESVASALTLPTKKNPQSPRRVAVSSSASLLALCKVAGRDETRPRAIGEAWDTAAGAGTLPQGKGTKRGSEVRRASAHLMRRRRRRRSTRLRALTIAQKSLRARGHGSRGVGGEPCGREEAQQPRL